MQATDVSYKDADRNHALILYLSVIAYNMQYQRSLLINLEFSLLSKFRIFQIQT